MVRMQAIEKQLQKIGSPIRYWGRAELRELQHILTKDEEIKFCLNGRYSGGFALLCVTDRRIILVDRKIFYLTLEDIRYDMISEVDYNYRLLDATISICTPNKTLEFTSYKKIDLRKLTNFVQTYGMELNQRGNMQPALQNYQEPADNLEPEPQLEPVVDARVSDNVVIQNVKTFVPRMPLRRRASNMYTNGPITRKSSHF